MLKTTSRDLILRSRVNSHYGNKLQGFFDMGMVIWQTGGVRRGGRAPGEDVKGCPGVRELFI